MILGGWCGERGRPHHKSCRSEVCQCSCGHPHRGTKPALHKASEGSAAVESGAQSGPESARTDRGLPITQLKDVTG